MEVMRLEARTDFRLEKLAGQPVWHVPADGAADAALDEAWRRLDRRSSAARRRSWPSRAAAAGAARRHGRRAFFVS